MLTGAATDATAGDPCIGAGAGGGAAGVSAATGVGAADTTGDAEGSVKLLLADAGLRPRRLGVGAGVDGFSIAS